jgi:hypothetical protein
LLPDRSVQIGSGVPGATTTYQLDFTIATAGTLGSIQAEFCSNDPLIGTACTPPNGFDISGATLSSQSGVAGFVIDPATTSNTLLLSRSPNGTAPVPVSFVLDDVVNPSDVGSFYVRLTTYASNDASGPIVDKGGIALAVAANINVSSYVPPYLLFCSGLVIVSYDCNTASGNYVNFGELSSTTTKADKSEMVVATNAAFGYGIFLGGSTMNSGTSTIPALTASDVSRPGTSQFGINLAANTSPPVGNSASGPGNGDVDPEYAIVDRFRFNPGEQLASGPGVSDYRKFTVSYIANIAKSQPAGIYVSTLTYICMANF